MHGRLGVCSQSINMHAGTNMSSVHVLVVTPCSVAAAGILGAIQSMIRSIDYQDAFLH